jgi:hypothetical protein
LKQKEREIAEFMLFRDCWHSRAKKDRQDWKNMQQVAHLLLALCMCATLAHGLRDSTERGTVAGERLFVPVGDSRVWIGGRHAWGTGLGGAEVALVDWPCALFNVSLRPEPSARIEGVGVVMEGGHNDFLVFFNDRAANGSKLLTDDRLREYPLPQPGLARAGDGLNVSLVKITEASYFALKALLPLTRVRLYGFAIYITTALPMERQPLLSPPQATARRRIEFFSDSDSNGALPLALAA